jgi:hypothetical protein
MKVNIEMNNLELLIQEAMSKNIETVIKDEVNKTINKTIEKETKGVVDEIVQMKMNEFVKEYIEKAVITVGGGFYSKEEAQTYTVEQYIRKELADVLSSKSLKVKKNDRYNDSYESISFEEFIKRSFNPEEIVRKELTKFIDDTKKEINQKINDTFTSVTKNMLSETVFNVLMKNDTFVQLNNSIKCITDKKE